MALVALAPLLCAAAAATTVEAGKSPTVHALAEDPSDQNAGDERQAGSAEAEPVIVVPASGIPAQLRPASAVPVASTYLPPDTPPLLRPPRPTSRA